MDHLVGMYTCASKFHEYHKARADSNAVEIIACASSLFYSYYSVLFSGRGICHQDNHFSHDDHYSLLLLPLPPPLPLPLPLPSLNDLIGMPFKGFDIPLEALSGEKFEQPILFGANNLSGLVETNVAYAGWWCTR